MQGEVGARRLPRAFEAVARRLPRGGALDDDAWHARHRGICLLLWGHVLVLPVLVWSRGDSYLHGLLEIALIGWLTLVAEIRRLGRGLRSATATAALLACSAMVVHIYDGLIEAHFHFFVMVAVVALYQAWLPYLLSLAFVILHHSLIGTLRPMAVYNHGSAQEAPLTWGLIHGGFILAESAACLIYWRSSELAITRERRLRSIAEEEHRQLQAAQVAIQQMAFQDVLTGLGNRRLFVDRLDAVLADERSSCAILFIDLDGFKQINDRHGHAAGDGLLQEVGRRIQGVVPDGDIVARFGGDEFAVLCHDADATEVALTARRIEGVLTQPAFIDGHVIRIGVSTGFAVATDGSSADLLLRRADAGMYAAKSGMSVGQGSPASRDSGPIRRQQPPGAP